MQDPVLLIQRFLPQNKHTDAYHGFCNTSYFRFSVHDSSFLCKTGSIFPAAAWKVRRWQRGSQSGHVTGKYQRSECQNIASVANGMNNLILSKKAEFINAIFCAAWVTTTTKTKNNNCSWNRICTCHNMRSYLAGLCLKRAPSSFLEESNTSEESVWPPLSCNLVENKHEG